MKKKRRDEWRSPYLQKRRVAAESDRDQSGRIVAVPFQLSTSERSKRRGGKTFRELGTEDREQHQRKLINESLNQSWGGTAPPPPPPPPPLLELQEDRNVPEEEEDGEEDAPLMYIDINIPSGETKRIEFFEGNSPDVIATEFARSSRSQ